MASPSGTIPPARPAIPGAPETEPRLGRGFAVFNGHLNDATSRANAEFVAQFGQEKFDQKIQPFHDKGIMSIFESGQSKWAMAWVTLLTAFVNEDRGA